VLASAADGTTSTAGNGQSSKVRLSGDGDLAVFESYSSNLTADSLGTVINIFVRTLSTKSTQLVSSDASGVAGNSLSFDPDISADGRYVAFWSYASNLVPGDGNATADIFVKDLTTGGIVIVSRDDSGVLGNDASLVPSISADGRFVAFESYATNFGVTTTIDRIYRHDRDPDGNGVFDEGNGVTELVGVDAFGNDARETCSAPRISGDGQRVLFVGLSYADHRLNQNRGNKGEAFLRDFASGKQRNVHVDSDGNHADHGVLRDGPHLLAISGDGTTAVYQTFADLDPNLSDNNLLLDVYAHDVAGDPAEYLGSDKLGSNGFFPEFSVVGGLATGESADFRLRRAPATSLAVVLISLSSNPIPLFGGTIVPAAPWLFLITSTDASGSITGTLNGGAGPLDVYVQWVIADASLTPRPFAISNALKVTIDP